MIKTKMYFAYGSNMLRRHMIERCPDAKYVGVASLVGWQFVYDGNSERWSNRAVGNIVPRKEGEVWGVLYAITAPDIERLNGFESWPINYQHKTVQVRLMDGRTVRAFVYIRNPLAVSHPDDDYKQTVISGAVEAGLPDRYIHEVLTG